MLSTADVINDLRNHRQVCAEITMIEAQAYHPYDCGNDRIRVSRQVRRGKNKDYER